MTTIGERLAFAADRTLQLRVGKVELGQGIVTALTQIAAEELDLSPAQVHVVSGDTAAGPDEWYTAGSLSVEVAGGALRVAAAAARHLLLAAAATRLGVPAISLTARDGMVCRDGVAQGIDWWDLAPSIDLERVPDGIGAPKDPAEYTVVGRPLRRLDRALQLGGGAYLHDLAPPGMLHGRVLPPPGPGAALLGFDRDAAARLPGVVVIVVDGSFVGIVTEREDEAARALDALPRLARWSPPSVPDPLAALRQCDAAAEIVSAGALFAADWRQRFSRPFLAHGSIGPSCALACWDADGLTVHAHSQGVYALRDALARVFGTPVRVIHTPGAGCYGHNGADDVALDAALLARAVPGRPVRVQWTREDELRWSPLGPAMDTTIEATLGADGRIAAMRLDILSAPHGTRPGASGGVNLLAAGHLAKAVSDPRPADFPTALGGGADRNAVPLYAIPNLAVAKRIATDLPVRTSSLRALGAFLNVFAIEATMDEMAARAGADPVAFRLRHLEHDPRAALVLERAATMIGWPGRVGDEGEALGIGLARYKNRGAWCAVAVDIVVEECVRVRRAVAAVDCGCAVNPDGVANQIEGGIVQAMSWTLLEAVPFDAAGPAAHDWEAYPILVFDAAPEIAVEIITDSALPALGVGEAAAGPTAAAVGNAVARALGVRVADLPLTRDRLLEAIAATG